MFNVSPENNTTVLTTSVKVLNLFTGVEMHFDAEMSPVSAVAYAYCEENQLLSKLFATMQNEQARAEFLATLPFTNGKLSLACGNWATLLVHDKQQQREILHSMMLKQGSDTACCVAA